LAPQTPHSSPLETTPPPLTSHRQPGPGQKLEESRGGALQNTFFSSKALLLSFCASLFRDDDDYDYDSNEDKEDDDDDDDEGDSARDIIVFRL